MGCSHHLPDGDRGLRWLHHTVYSIWSRRGASLSERRRELRPWLHAVVSLGQYILVSDPWLETCTRSATRRGGSYHLSRYKYTDFTSRGKKLLVIKSSRAKIAFLFFYLRLIRYLLLNQRKAFNLIKLNFYGGKVIIEKKN